MIDLSNTPFENFEIPKNVEVSLKDTTLCITRFNWEYKEALAFQKYAQSFIQKNRKLKIFIFCNHPHCFTMGRGNERGQDQLEDFTDAQAALLSFPLNKIRRGGGITFHYPGQWIFYPILALNENFGMCDLTSWLLKSVRDVLTSEFKIDKVLAANKLLGVWREKQKIASIGVGVDRFVTEHGIAVNLITDERMFNELNKINPCGMAPTTYIAADALIKNSDEIISRFHQAYISSHFKS